MKEVLFQSKVVGTDDTSVKVLDVELPFARTGSTMTVEQFIADLDELVEAVRKRVHGELIESRGDWSLVQPSTVPPPLVRIETYW